MIPGIRSGTIPPSYPPRLPLLETADSGAATTPRTYLDELNRALEPAAIAKAEECASKFATYAKIAKIIAIVLPTLGALATAMLAAPVYLFIALPAGLLFLGSGVFLSHGMREISDDFQTLANFSKEIKAQKEQLAHATIDELQGLLSDDGVNWSEIPGMSAHPENLALLKSLIAASQVYRSQAQKYSEESSAHLTDFKSEWLAQNMKISHAFCNAMILHPHNPGIWLSRKCSDSDIEHLYPITSQNSNYLWSLVQLLPPANSNHVVDISYQEVATSSVAQLTQSIRFEILQNEMRIYRLETGPEEGAREAGAYLLNR